MSSSSRVSPKKHDVFISFRGEDTRENFTSHLHSALRDKNILTYIDDQLKRGDDVGPALEKAIKDSLVSVVVFSERYATSKWCLQELVMIMKCRREEGQVVLPVFYKTNPTDVRNQTGSYQKPFEDYDRLAAASSKREDGQNKVGSWRAALAQAANISGWNSSNHKDDSQFIWNIVNDVSQKLHLRYPNKVEGLVGIEEHCGEIGYVLGNVGRIGIWGVGGIGKSTIAKAIFVKYFPQYDSVCFLENVREESQKHGLPYIRDKLLSELLKEQVTTSNISGSTFIKRRLSSRKVLIVIDDVDSFEQLEYLHGEFRDLGQGSHLIVTTRDKHLLNGRVDKIYEVKQWNFQESLVLFSLAAFQTSNPKKGYEDLSQRAVEYAGGVPLALKVLGSHFHSRNDPEFWKSELKYLESKKEPLKKIQEVLQVSYKGLERSEQQAIFLDIAFFFKDENKDSVIRILNACGFNATSGIEILQDKGLISVSNINTIQMHDLLRDMAFDIVRKGITDPGRRSRLRDTEEVQNVLQNDKEAREVEGVALDLSEAVGLQLSDDIFNRMPNLRLLRLYVPAGKQRSAKVHYYSSLLHMRDSAGLKYLEWSGYPSKSLPPNFCAKFLVEIRMPQSHVEELWQGTQDLAHLETIDLSECKQLVKLPDLSKASKIKWVYLSKCESLCFVHLLSVETLVTLMLDGCKKLKILISEKHLSNLQEFNVDDCSSLEEFSVSSDSINRLDLSKLGVKKLYSSIGRLSKLVWLNLEGSRLQYLPDELSYLTSLKELIISNCGVVIKEKLHVLFAGLRSLQLLHLKDCYNLFELPDNISALSSLHELRLNGTNVKKLPTSIKLLEQLEILSLDNCRKLQFLPELPLCIKELCVVNCTSLVTVSTLKIFSVKMIGLEKKISFLNGMNLNECSLLQIMEDTLFTMKSAVLHNVFVTRFGLSNHRYRYNNVGVCFPGSSIPSGSGQGLFEYRATGSSITIELPARHLSHSLMTVYSVVLSPSPGIKQHRANVKCRIYSIDDDSGERQWMDESGWYAKDIEKFNSDHVCVWHVSCCELNFVGKKLCCFEFLVITDSEEEDEPIKIKECGINLICFSDSELHHFLREAADLELQLKLELGFKYKLALDLMQGDNKILIRLCDALELGIELDESMKSKLESRRRAVLTLIEMEEGKSQQSNSSKVVIDCSSYDDDDEEGEEVNLQEDMDIDNVSVHNVEEELERTYDFADDEAHDACIEAGPNYSNLLVENDVPPIRSQSRTMTLSLGEIPPQPILQLMDSDNSPGDETADLNYAAPASAQTNLPIQDAHAEKTSVQSTKDCETSDNGDPLADVDSLFSGSQKLSLASIQSSSAKDITHEADALALAHRLQNLIAEDLTALASDSSRYTEILQCLFDLNNISGLPEEVKECTSSLVSVAGRLPTTIASAVKVMADHHRASAHKAKMVESVNQARQKKTELAAAIEKNVVDINMFDQRIAALKLAVNLMEADRQKLVEAGASYNKEEEKRKKEAKALAVDAKNSAATLNEINLFYPESAKDFAAAQATIEASKFTLAKFISSFAKPDLHVDPPKEPMAEP